MIEEKFIPLNNFIPNFIFTGKRERKVKLYREIQKDYIKLFYITEHYNNAKRRHSVITPKEISCSKKTFEVLGLLQAEMTKANDGCLTFANSEYRLVNKVMAWFDKEFDLGNDSWRWSITLNMNEPKNQDYKKIIEDKVIKHWINKTKISENMGSPKTVLYIKDTKHKKLKPDYYGSLVIAHKQNLFSQIIKNYVKLLSYDIYNLDEDYIRAFMKGIIAGEGCIFNRKKSGHYRVSISACKEEERKIYQKALNKLGIKLRLYDDYKETVISGRKYLVKLLKQRLMTLHPRKYNKFLNMMRRYPRITEETGYFRGSKKPWNKTPEEKIREIVDLYNSGIISTKEIAGKLNLGLLKVQRVFKEKNLGKRMIKYPKEMRKEIALFAKENPKLTHKEIAEIYEVSLMCVGRACKKYKIDRGNKSRIKIPRWKEYKIIEMYKKNPIVKVSDIMNEVGISNTVVKRVRRENNLSHLGFKYLIGCNNPNNY